ncbi:RNA polymerase factor sigma-54 [Alishewanella longhuensis]
MKTCSSTAILQTFTKINCSAAAENPPKPPSDSKLEEILSDQGINVARRTIARCREALFIPPGKTTQALAVSVLTRRKSLCKSTYPVATSKLPKP